VTRLTLWSPPTLVTGLPAVSITEREADVLAGIAHGHTNAEIGDRLYLGEETVKIHVRSLLRKMGAQSRTHAAALACSGQLAVHVKDARGRRAA
jgi:DNA-binding NarL/FixJ family response regulator